MAGVVSAQEAPQQAREALNPAWGLRLGVFPAGSALWAPWAESVAHWVAAQAHLGVFLAEWESMVNLAMFVLGISTVAATAGGVLLFVALGYPALFATDRLAERVALVAGALVVCALGLALSAVVAVGYVAASATDGGAALLQ